MIDGTVAQQVDHDRSGRPISRYPTLSGAYDLCLGMAAAHGTPIRERLQFAAVVAAEPVLFSLKHEPIRVRVPQHKTIIIAAQVGRQTNLGLDPPSAPPPAEELVVRSALHLNEVGQPGRPEHPAQHLEESDDIGLSGTVGADNDRHWRKTLDLHVRQ